jgi:hypothetical protein
MLFPSCQRPRLTPIQYNSQDYSFVYINIFIFKQEVGKQKFLKQMVASIPQI